MLGLDDSPPLPLGVTRLLPSRLPAGRLGEPLTYPGREPGVSECPTWRPSLPKRQGAPPGHPLPRQRRRDADCRLPTSGSP